MWYSDLSSTKKYVSSILDTLVKQHVRLSALLWQLVQVCNKIVVAYDPGPVSFLARRGVVSATGASRMVADREECIFLTRYCHFLLEFNFGVVLYHTIEPFQMDDHYIGARRNA